MQKYVTDSLKSLLKKELQEIGASQIPILLQQAVEKGESSYALKLDSGGFGHERVSNVLSEGEQRAVSIASFLAEIEQFGHTSGIVFDDPVSSLDHIWRHRVAQRLVKEGQKRQVIIFTHDIVFLNALQDEAREQEIPIGTKYIRSKSTGKGFCDIEGPWDAMKGKHQLMHIEGKLQKAKSYEEKGDSSLSETLRRECIDLLRQSWERTVEEILFKQVVERFNQEINTMKLRYVEVTDADYKIIYDSIKRLSGYGVSHTSAAAKMRPLPTTTELDTEIQGLRNYRKELNKRQEVIHKQRQELVK